MHKYIVDNNVISNDEYDYNDLYVDLYNDLTKYAFFWNEEKIKTFSNKVDGLEEANDESNLIPKEDIEVLQENKKAIQQKFNEVSKEFDNKDEKEANDFFDEEAINNSNDNDNEVIKKLDSINDKLKEIENLLNKSLDVLNRIENMLLSKTNTKVYKSEQEVEKAIKSIEANDTVNEKEQENKEVEEEQTFNTKKEKKKYMGIMRNI